jgi:hypothetical protein
MGVTPDVLIYSEVQNMSVSQSSGLIFLLQLLLNISLKLAHPDARSYLHLFHHAGHKILIAPSVQHLQFECSCGAFHLTIIFEDGDEALALVKFEV